MVDPVFKKLNIITMKRNPRMAMSKSGLKKSGKN